MRLIIDAVMFICLALLAGIGLLLKYVFVSGQEANIEYGARVEQFVLGMGEHEWGNIHLIVGIIMIAFLIIHIILNWNPIVRILQRMIRRTLTRRIVAVAFAVIAIVCVIFPFFLDVEIRARDDEGGKWQQQQQD